MKSLSTHISESLLTGSVSKPDVYVHPSSKDELQQIIDEYIGEIKPQPGQKVDLNWIDISLVDDLSEVFRKTDYIPVIDKWNIDHVKKFDYMFAHNIHIVRSPLPVLQENLLADECYGKMFCGCTSLREPPKLPATKLATCCYWGMFWNCKKLKKAPVLPAKKLEPYCYRSMFEGCSSLVDPPELPAKEKVDGCYQYMFRNCHSLKKTPEPPSLTDTGMFDGCSSLKKTITK